MTAAFATAMQDQAQAPLESGVATLRSKKSAAHRLFGLDGAMGACVSAVHARFAKRRLAA